MSLSVVGVELQSQKNAWLEQGTSQLGALLPGTSPQERPCRAQEVPGTQAVEFGLEAEEGNQVFKASLCYLV